jgi:hypothetical protein
MTSALVLSGFGLMSAGAIAASASPQPGTTGPGSWSFDPGDGSNAIQLPATSTSSSTSTAYQAQVQQPINSDGSSVFSAKSRTIPVKYKVQSQSVTTTTTTTTAAVYPDILLSDSDAWAFSKCPGGVGPSCYGALSFTPPAGTKLSDITNLEATFQWLSGHNAGGSMRWSIVTSMGTFYVYYGDESTSFQTGQGGSGINMTTPIVGARVETPELGPGVYVTWSDLIHGTGGVATGDPSATVSQIDLVVDAGYTGTQRVQLSDVQITDNGATSEYVPGTIAGSTSTSTTSTPWVNDTTDPAWVYLNEVNGATPGQAVDENLVDTQGDNGGQYRVVDGMYMYNFPVSNLKDPTATYQIGISFHSDGSSPVGVVPFGTK